MRASFKVRCETNPAVALAMQRMFFNFDRAENLCRIYTKDIGSRRGRKQVHDADVLRAAVVLTHAALEDSLRTIASYYLPRCSAEELDKIPLAGINQANRPEKFLLGHLSEFKGQMVDKLIEHSVSDYLGKLSFNSVSDVASMVDKFGIKSDELKTNYPLLEKMISRRHQIVHRADRVERGGRGKQYADSINPRLVSKWINNTFKFVLSLSILTLGVGEKLSIQKV